MGCPCNKWHISRMGGNQFMKIVLNAATAEGAEAGGAGWIMTAGYADSPFGTVLIAECPRGICHLMEVHDVTSVCQQLGFPQAGFDPIHRVGDGAQWLLQVELHRLLTLFEEGRGLIALFFN